MKFGEIHLVLPDEEKQLFVTLRDVLERLHGVMERMADQDKQMLEMVGERLRVLEAMADSFQDDDA